MDAYIQNNFRDGTTRACLCFNQDGNLQVDISCINTNFNSFWGGEWQASWKIDTQNNALNGTIKINNHYFEQGNIHFSLHKDFENIPLENADADGIIAAINKTETKYQEDIERMHETMGDAMKRMRRTLPVTG